MTITEQQVELLSHEELVQAYLSLYQKSSRQEGRIGKLSKKTTLLEEKNSELQETTTQLKTRNADLKAQNDWLRRQLFGKRSEKVLCPGNSWTQLCLGEGYEPDESPPPEKTAVKSYERSHRKNEIEFKEEDSRLKFDSSVPLREIHVPHPATAELSKDQYEVIGEEVCHKLLQLPGSYEVLKYIRPKVKIKGSGEIRTAPLTRASSVIEKSIAEVSFIAGLLIDKFLYHLPLYRQHQRLTACGVYISRMTLTNLVHRAAQLLEAIYVSQKSSILLSHVLALDETPVKAGRKVRGRMHQGYLWGAYGDKDELCFLYSSSRSGKLIADFLKSFVGTLITDGYSVYELFASQRDDVFHAQCWVHARRKFFEAQEIEPALCSKALELIGKLYQIEASLPRKERASQATPVVDEFFSWLKDTFQEKALLPSSPFTKAASYALERERALRVFLHDEKVPLDTNHLERQIRPVAIGRKNWLFCWTEVGAEYAAIVQSLIATCRLQGIDPYTYLVDVLQRVESHPMREVHLLTPRLWKENFADKLFTSDLCFGKNAAG